MRKKIRRMSRIKTKNAVKHHVEHRTLHTGKMIPTAWFTTVNDAQNVGFDRTAILPRGVASLLLGADLLAVNDASNILMVMSSEYDHADVDRGTTLMTSHFLPMDDALKWCNVPSRGWALMWRPRDVTEMAYFRVQVRSKIAPSARLSVVAFPAVSCSHTFEKERARAVFVVANDTKPDVVLFGAGIAENRESMRTILEERRRVLPTCRIAFVGGA